MPLYEYLCRGCGNEFELLVRAADPAPTCPSCNASDLERLLSGFAVSSAGIRDANVRAAKKKAAADPARRDKRIADQEYSRGHLVEDGVLPEPGKTKK